MTTTRQPRSPSFFWQGLLILLPVALLVSIGIGSWIQDRQIAERELRERAQNIADGLALRFLQRAFPGEHGTPGLRTNLIAGNTLLLQAFPNLPLISLRGDEAPANVRLHLAPPLPEPIDAESLPAPLPDLWWRARAAGPSGLETSQALSAAEALLTNRLPARLALLTEYQRSALLLRVGRTREATLGFEQLLPQATNVSSEAGLPLRQLVQLRLLELWPLDKIMAGWTQEIAEAIQQGPPPVDIVSLSIRGAPYDLHPWLRRALQEASPLTTPLMQAADRIRLPVGPGFYQAGQPVESRTGLYREAWERRSRDLDSENEFRLALRSAVQGSGSQFPRMLWLDWRGQTWLTLRWDVVPVDPKDGLRFFLFWLLTPPQVVMLARAAINDGGDLPAYLGVSFEIAGREAGDLAVPEPATSLARPQPATHPLWRANVTNRTSASPTNGTGHSRGLPRWASASELAASANVAAGAVPVIVRVSLTDAPLFFQRLRQRQAILAALVGVSALAAVIGFFAAWRAFRKQLRLAEMKSNFVSSVSHELRAPLASVRLMAESLERGTVQTPAKQNEYFRFIVQECRRLSSLIENVLDFARIEQGRKQYEFEPTDLVALVEQTAKLMEPNAAEKQITLAVNLDKSPLAALPSPPTLDGRAIQQALVNLIDNAIKHSPAGSTVTVGLECSAAATHSKLETRNSKPGTRNPELEALPSHFLLSVADHGEGIPPEEHAKIFRRFYRRGSELRRETQGVGIGLSLVKHIVEAHGGRVRVESAIGQGSRFTIELPATPQTEYKPPMDSDEHRF